MTRFNRFHRRMGSRGVLLGRGGGSKENPHFLLLSAAAATTTVVTIMVAIIGAIAAMLADGDTSAGRIIKVGNGIFAEAFPFWGMPRTPLRQQNLWRRIHDDGRILLCKRLHATTRSIHENGGGCIKGAEMGKDQRENERKRKNTGIYIHIPYCRRRCSYCDFAIVPVGDVNAQKKHQNQETEMETLPLSGFEKMDLSYRKAVTAEIDLLIQSLKHQSASASITSTCERPIQLSSIYFGGGTPSLAPLDTIRTILHHILGSEGEYTMFSLVDGAEITVEMDPGTFTTSHLQALKEIGVNRISLGVQSFNDTILEGIGRAHRQKDILEALDSIQEVFGSESQPVSGSGSGSRSEGTTPNYSLDLISGLPGLTPPLWKETIQTALNLSPRPNHLSIYDLQIEDGTAFAKWYPDRHQDEDDDDNYDDEDDKKGERGYMNTNDMTSAVTKMSNPSDGRSASLLPLPSSQDCADMYKFASEHLRANGFEHYEISSYARLRSLESTSQSMPALNSSTTLTNLDVPSPSYRSRHNQIYWAVDSEWYAVGLSATSSIRGRRFARPRMMADYIHWVEEERRKASASLKTLDEGNLSQSSESESEMSTTQDYLPWQPDWLPKMKEGATTDREAADAEEQEEREERLLDTIMTRLRTKEGLDLKWIAQQQNGDLLLQNVLDGAKLGLDLGLAQRVVGEEVYEGDIARDDENADTTGDFLRLVDPDGFLFSNNIISSIFAEIP